LSWVKRVSRITAIAGVICLALIGIVVTSLNLSEPLDRKLLDAEFRLLRANFPRPAPEVVVVGVDEATVAQFYEPITLWHPHIAKLLTAMMQAKPAAVGIDLVLPDRSYDRVVPGYDVALLKSIVQARRAFPVVLALTIDPTGKPRPIHRPFLTAAGDGGTGYALLPVDADGIVRRFDERLGEGGAAVPTLVGQISRRLGIEPEPGLIDYGRGAAFDYLPLHRVLEWFDSGKQLELERAFAGKPVLLGVVLPFDDRQSLPVALAAWEQNTRIPGVLLHAQALRTLIGHGSIQPAASTLVMLLSVAAAFLWMTPARRLIALLAFSIAVTAILFASIWLLSAGWFLPVVAPLGVACFAVGGRIAYEALLQLRERRRLRSAFAGYVIPPIMDEILTGQLQPDLGGTSKYVCVMFADIRGYTTRSESMTPHAVIAFLNRYFEQVVRIIHARGGSVVSFMGDGIMAIFGAPKPLANPCAEAFAAAREMLDYVRQFNTDTRAAGEMPIEIGIGLHGGEEVVGHVGSTMRHDYSAIGDVTNVAARLESLTKEVAYRLVFSKTVADELPDPQRVTSLGPVAIKGHSPVEVYGYDKI